jgi:1-acyl-sn-glycerol-3-phosphate acyltransferase
MFAITLIPFYPITALLVFNTKTRKWSTYVFWFWSLVLSFLFLIFVKKNKTKIPDEPLIIIANHTSYLDIFMMYQILPFRPIVFMGKSEILDYPLIKTYFKFLHIPVDRSDKRKAAQSMLQAKSKLQEGWSIVIFPEGGIEDGLAPKMAEFKPGAFVMAQKNKVAILPISLITHYKLLTEPQNTRGSSRPGLSKVYLHPLMHLNEIEEKSIEELSAIAQSTIASKLNLK